MWPASRWLETSPRAATNVDLLSCPNNWDRPVAVVGKKKDIPQRLKFKGKRLPPKGADSSTTKGGCPPFLVDFLHKILNIPKLPFPAVQQNTTSLLMNTATRLLSPGKRSTVWTVRDLRVKHWQSCWLKPLKMGQIGPKPCCHV